MKSRPRNASIAGVTLIVVALLVMVVASLYVMFAPRVFSSGTLVTVTFAPPKSRPARLDELPLQVFNQERNLAISQAKGSSVIKIDAFAPEPEAAAARANQCAAELRKAVESRLAAQFSILASAEPLPRPVRPAKQKILAIAGLASMNLGVAGVACLIVGFLRKRGKSARQVPLQVPT